MDKIGVSIYKQVQNIAVFIIFSGAVVILLCFSSIFHLFCFVCLLVVHTALSSAFFLHGGLQANPTKSRVGPVNG